MMTSAQGFETSATFTDSSPPQDYSYLDDQTTPSNITPAFKTLRVTGTSINITLSYEVPK